MELITGLVLFAVYLIFQILDSLNLNS